MMRLFCFLRRRSDFFRKHKEPRYFVFPVLNLSVNCEFSFLLVIIVICATRIVVWGLN